MKLSSAFMFYGRSIGLVAIAVFTAFLPVYGQDMQADNMLVYQRAIGGWPKHIRNVKVDYTKPISNEQLVAIKADSLKKDATIDNGSTVKEIRYLAKAYLATKNEAYKAALQKGIKFLLKAQNSVGGWPQFYPDSSLYRGQITYNDNAMANVLNLLMDISLGINNMDIVDAAFRPAVKDAIAKGVDCIVATQIKVNDNLTGWCAQHDRKTLLPVDARKFEKASISGAETVGIVAFLMRIKDPSPAVKDAVNGAVNWLKSSKIAGYRYEDVKDEKQPKGFDRLLIADPSSVVWARFYDIDTNKPFVCGRDGVKKYDLKEIESERRTGYAWYGIWPQKLIDEKYPKWLKQNAG